MTRPIYPHIMLSDADADTVLLWTKRIIILFGMMFLVAARIFPAAPLIGIAFALSFIVAIFYHMGFGSLYDAFVSTLIFIACFGYAILAIIAWPIGVLLAGIILMSTKKLNDKLEQDAAAR